MNNVHYSATIYAPDGTAQTITLTKNDLQFVDADGNAITPTNAGTYTVALSPSAETRLKNLTGNNDNYTWTFKTTVTYNIASTTASAGLSESNRKVFDGSGVTTAQINHGGSIEVTFTYPGSTDSSMYKLQDGDYTWNTSDHNAPKNDGIYTITLTDSGLDLDALSISGTDTVSGTALSDTEIQASDFDWYYASGNKLDEVPNNVGTYEARLTDRALAALQNANPNYSFSEVNGTIKYMINPKVATDKLGNSGTKTYNGQGTSVSDIINSVTWNPGGLVTGNDYEWMTKNTDGTYSVMTGLPTNVGPYYLKLMDSGITKIKNANTNYSFADGAISGEMNNKLNAGLHGPNSPIGESGPISPTSDEQAIGPKSAIFNHTTNGKNENAKKNELPQTGSAHEGPLAWLGSLFAGLSLFGLAADKKRKKTDDK
ncbi:MBG domain-containing protein [Lactobacillus amylovorus]|uniref:MBG domain-containing protein n=1 Tax=Lactobacillus amylovorus TaxID=1604 RepID=UPI0022E723D0|nr:MBG domain-containing protein [Lactobacillus amylovorus]